MFDSVSLLHVNFTLQKASPEEEGLSRVEKKNYNIRTQKTLRCNLKAASFMY